MNKYKTMVKYEFRNLKWIFLYFCVVFGFLTYIIHDRMKYDYRYFLIEGISQIYNQETSFYSVLNAFYIPFMLFALGGILLMVYLQFRESKQVEVGRFLKVLPIEAHKHYQIKILCGLITFMVPFIIFVLLLLRIRGAHLLWIQDLQVINIASEIYQVVDSVSYLLVVLGLYGLILIFSYLFMVMMQYLITQSIASIVIGILIGVSPAYLLISVDTLLHYDFIDGTLINISFPWAYGMGCREWNWIDSSMYEHVIISFVQDMGLRFVIISILCILCLVIGNLLSKRFKIEQMDLIIPEQIMRHIFVAGVTVCSAFLPVTIRGIFNIRLEGIETIILGISMLVLGGIGYMISKKISRIGTKKGGEK